MSAARRELRPGYSISRLINGGWQLSTGHRPGGGEAAGRLDQLQRLLDAGLTTFDCADIYTGVEELYGRLIARHRRAGGDRDDLQIHTKCVPDLDLLPRLRFADVERTVDRSLVRLGVDHLDLVQFHWWDWSVGGWLEAIGWLDDLRRAGKIRHLALTNFDTAHLAAVLDAGFDIVAHQVQYSLLDRRPERSMARLCRRHGVHLLAYGSLAGGFLSDRWHGLRAPDEPLENRSLVKYRLILEEAGGWSRFQRLLDRLGPLAEARGLSIANLAVRWVLDRPGVAAAVVGAGTADHLADNLRVLGLVQGEGEGAALQAAIEELDPLPGDVYGMEREVEGRHARIMRTHLNRD